MRTSTVVLFVLFLWGASEVHGQGIFSKQLPKHTYDSTVVDSTYGIVMYERLNASLGGDSIRKCGVYPCQNWQTDQYTSGQMLHKGFYIDGQLKTYKNYYPNGNVEREFIGQDNFNSSVKLYYSSGQMKSSIKYKDGVAKEWTDYHPNGQVMYEEKMNNKMEYYVYQKFYYADGKPQKITEQKEKKGTIFKYEEYNSNGTLKVQGEKLVTSDGQFINHGVWKYFDDKGSVSRSEKWDHGTKISG